MDSIIFWVFAVIFVAMTAVSTASGVTDFIYKFKKDKKEKDRKEKICKHIASVVVALVCAAWIMFAIYNDNKESEDRKNKDKEETEIRECNTKKIIANIHNESLRLSPSDFRAIVTSKSSNPSAETDIDNPKLWIDGEITSIPISTKDNSPLDKTPFTFTLSEGAHRSPENIGGETIHTYFSQYLMYDNKEDDNTEGKYGFIYSLNNKKITFKLPLNDLQHKVPGNNWTHMVHIFIKGYSETKKADPDGNVTFKLQGSRFEMPRDLNPLELKKDCEKKQPAK